jgi:hypothetical protein
VCEWKRAENKKNYFSITKWSSKSKKSEEYVEQLGSGGKRSDECLKR